MGLATRSTWVAYAIGFNIRRLKSTAKGMSSLATDFAAHAKPSATTASLHILFTDYERFFVIPLV